MRAIRGLRATIIFTHDSPGARSNVFGFEVMPSTSYHWMIDGRRPSIGEPHHRNAIEIDNMTYMVAQLLPTVGGFDGFERAG